MNSANRIRIGDHWRLRTGILQGDLFMRSMTALLVAVSFPASLSADSPRLVELTRDFEATVRPFLNDYCLSCHGTSKQESRFDLSPFTSLETVRADPGHWQLVLTRLRAGEMPPEDAPKRPSTEQRDVIVRWIEALRKHEAEVNAGDPGPVPARRLTNTEYDYTIRDLTGVDLRPAREFPLDPANVAGFTNSGESLTMSPALFSRYLAAAQHVSDHLVLLPTGFIFSPHPAITWSDRDKFAVRRIVDFYLARKIDYAEFLLAAWQFRHRVARQEPELTLDDAAAARGLSRKYVQSLWEILQDGKDHRGPIAELRQRWNMIPSPPGDAAELPLTECRALRDWIVAERNKRQFAFPLVMIPQLNPSTQPGILWKNRLIAEHRHKGTLTDEEQQDNELRQAIERFCDVFPDRFMLTERGRMNLPFEKQNKGRLLGAGFHLQFGYYRDDGPLYEMLLSEDEKDQLDEMWHELNFVTDAPVRQFQDYVYFERAEGREIITEAEFDFARGEDRSVVSLESMGKFSRLYVSAVRKRDLDEQAVEEIAQYFVDLSKRIQTYEQARVEAEPIHLRTLLQFAAKAWRRPLAADESRQLLKNYRMLREQDELGHEDAIRDVVVSILASPFFCYRVDRASETDGRLSGFALANRLSYFLWSSMPDEQLRALARTEELQHPDILRSQVQRMLNDDRSQAMAVEFAGYWLDFRQFQNHVGVDRTEFPQFNNELRESMFQEPVCFVSDLIRQDRPVRELLEGDHTFVDSNLAELYQIPYSVEAADRRGWMRVDNAPDFGRGGLLPMAIFLTQSSPGLRTSPVKRGYWVVRRLLGEQIPPPPPNVPELPKDEAELGERTLRQVLEKHREIESCAVCHARFDFAGLVFEGYGPIGERRTRDLGGKPVDDGTVFPDGTSGNGLPGLRAYLFRNRQEQFDDNFCRKLLAYGLGRHLLLSDESTIDRMKQEIADRNGRFSSLITKIVTSTQFLHKRLDAPVVEAAN